MTDHDTIEAIRARLAEYDGPRCGRGVWGQRWIPGQGRRSVLLGTCGMAPRHDGRCYAMEREIFVGADEARALLAEIDRLRRALDAIARANEPDGGCLPSCASCLDDYRVNDCDCGYVEAASDVAEYARDVLDGEGR